MQFALLFTKIKATFAAAFAAAFASALSPQREAEVKKHVHLFILERQGKVKDEGVFGL